MLIIEMACVLLAGAAADHNDHLLDPDGDFYND